MKKEAKIALRMMNADPKFTGRLLAHPGIKCSLSRWQQMEKEAAEKDKTKTNFQNKPK